MNWWAMMLVFFAWVFRRQA
ncbi:MAG: GlyGly-CTERM sorting domain-containing protein [Chloroflexi bacterium]|nr:GlyGly-CTERM sorting domain-containing protein [Chloroflexota bacterium]